MGAKRLPSLYMTQPTPAPILLIDARNALYRAVFAIKNDTRQVDKYHYFVILLRQMTAWMNKYRPESVHVFWDAPRTTVWRRKILETYKTRPNNTGMDISEELSLTTKVAKDFFKFMNVRQYDKETQEADDLIYSAAVIAHPRSSIIVSTDSDMEQIPFMINSCTVYNPSKQEEVATSDIHPAIQKALVGDKSDSIDGYYGIGPKKSEAFLRNKAELQQFLDLSGWSTYYRNLLLIDLSLNPKALANRIYVQKQMAAPVQYDEKIINELIHSHKVNGMLAEYANLIRPFKKLV